jgi:hypothetical protein
MERTGEQHESDRRPVVDDMGAELEGPSLVSSLAAILVAAAAVSLAVLPAAIALRVLALPVGWVSACLGSLGAAVFGVKLLAIAWAMGARLLGARRAGGAVAYSD